MKHAIIGSVFALAGAASAYAFAFFGWLTAFYTRQDLVRAAQVRANVWFVILIVSVVGFALNGWWWWRSRRNVSLELLREGKERV